MYVNDPPHIWNHHIFPSHSFTRDFVLLFFLFSFFFGVCRSKWNAGQFSEPQIFHSIHLSLPLTPSHPDNRRRHCRFGMVNLYHIFGIKLYVCLLFFILFFFENLCAKFFFISLLVEACVYPFWTLKNRCSACVCAYGQDEWQMNSDFFFFPFLLFCLTCAILLTRFYACLLLVLCLG